MPIVFLVGYTRTIFGRYGLFGRLAVPVAAAVCALVLAPAGATAEKGVVADLTWGISRAEVDRTIALMRGAGVKWVRTNVSWSGAEPREGAYNEGWLADIDYAVAAARRAGIDVLMPISDGVPYWASADPDRHRAAGVERWNKYYRPADPADYGRFVRYLVDRYKLRGVHAYEIWNEPNHRRFWPSGPSPAEYVPLLKAGYEGVKAADPSATVVLGGLSKSDYRYLQGVYDAGGGRYFDVAAVHPYTVADPTKCWRTAGRPALDAFCALAEVRRTMVANGDRAKQLWVTEYGWSSSPLAPWSVDEPRQAEFLRKALAQLDRYDWVGPAFYYGFRNLYWANDDPKDWEANLGLLRTDFSPKPAFFAYRAHEPAAIPTPRREASQPRAGRRPSLRLRVPSSFARTLRLRVFAGPASRRLARVEFRLDGRRIATDRRPPYAATWMAPRSFARGVHRIQVVAVEASGRRTTRSAAVVRR